jgi:class 3 adenylate cyclase/predicted ATPase
MDIVVWLRSLGLEQYEAAFRENAIDVSVLPDLTDQDLEKLGVLLGHRRKLLRAIANLETIAKAVAGAVGAPVAVDASPRDTAERRQVTVMFSDLVGSTALSARMDPEDLREVISAYQKCVAETVQRFGGFVAKYMGDGVLVYFGYPQAHEDDAERAVRAGLELVAALGLLKTHASLQTRVGIATGIVVVGDLIGSGASQEQAIIGETPNLAARLQSVAEPSSVVIAESTRKLLGNLFQLEDLGAHDLKGISGAVRAWAALRPASVESRFDALHATGLTELVGREEELDLLLRRWSKAKTGEGQAVLLSGEPGIGKSRLTAALIERLAAEPHTRLRYFCSPQHTDSALYPIISQMERAAGFAYDDTAQAKLDKLDALLGQNVTSSQDTALFAEMLSLPNDGRYPRLELPPQQRRQKTLEALAAQMEALAQSNPVLIIFDDVHWIDPTSLETLGRIVDRLKTLGVLLIITHRPEFEPPWIGRSYLTAVTLNRLGEREIASMIEHVTGNRALPENIRQDIIERTDGIPLFVEEMTKAVLEAESESDARRTAAAVLPSAVPVPASLHAFLMSRLDRLGRAKEVAQVGAAIGRVFSYALLAAVVRKPADLQSALGSLLKAGLLFEQGAPPHASYLFKHALVQDAAYGTLLRDARRSLHARIANTFENEFIDIAENQPEVLARHYTEAGLIDKAAGYWGKAGLRSLSRSALPEASEQLSRALAQIDALPETPALHRNQITLQIALINILMPTKGHAAPETKAALERARSMIEQCERLAEPLEDPLILFSVLYGFWVSSLVAFNGDAIRDLANQFLIFAEKDTATAPLMLAHRIMGSSLQFTGHFTDARTHLDRANALYDETQHRALATRFGQDAQVALRTSRSQVLWFLGYPDAALMDADQAIRYARAINHAPSLMHALGQTNYTFVCSGKYLAIKANIDELAALANDKGALFWKCGSELIQGSFLYLTDRAASAIQVLNSGIAAYRSIGSVANVPWFLSLLARAYADVGQFNDARRCICETVALMGKTGEKWFEAEVYRVAGELAFAGPKPDATKAEAYFERALTVANQQQAKSWELRVAMSLARLWRDQGKVSQARELLAPVYWWFTEGFDTRDLKEAKALLEELA